MIAHLKRTALRFNEQQLGDRAAALTYYAVLSLFPGLALLVSILGLFGTEGTVDDLLEVVDELGPESAVDTLREPVDQIASRRSGAGFLAVISLAATLWAASGYLGAFRRAVRRIQEREEPRSALLLRPLQLGITLGIVLIVAVLLSAIVASGPLAEAIGRTLGLGGVAITAWSVAKWPVLVLGAVGLAALLYWTAAAPARPHSRELLPGSALAASLWLIGSAGFALYISNLGSYDATYGSLGAVIVFLIWTWLSNAALLLGAIFNDEWITARSGDRGPLAASL